MMPHKSSSYLVESISVTNQIYRHRRLLTALLLALAGGLNSIHQNSAEAQDQHDFGTWFSLNTQGPLTVKQNTPARLRWWFDGHLRYLTDSGGFHQTIMRPGIGYALNDRTSIWMGYGWINELPTNQGPIFDENRFWQQLIWNRPIGRSSYMSRTRLEQRFRDAGDDTGWRLRQFCKLSVPLDCQKRWSWVVWDEIFFDLNETDWGQIGSFSQNRMFTGLGCNLKGLNRPRIEVGYLNQFIRNPIEEDPINHVVSANWFWSF